MGLLAGLVMLGVSIWMIYYGHDASYHVGANKFAKVLSYVCGGFLFFFAAFLTFVGFTAINK